MGSEPKIDRLDKDDLKTLCCAAATMLADKEDEITMLRAQLAAAEARAVELESDLAATHFHHKKLMPNCPKCKEFLQ